MTDVMTLTYQTRLKLDDESENILSDYALLFNTVERSLFSEIAKGEISASCKKGFLTQYGITARQFNALRISLEGKIAAFLVGQEQAFISLKQKIESVTKEIQKLEKKNSKHFILHQKKRRLNTLLARLSSREKDRNEGRIRLCFGGKKLFHAQFHLERNGYSSHSDWKRDWEAKRNSEFFVIGSKDETAGNQSCVATVQEDGSLNFRLRLPNSFIEKHGKYIEIKNVSFAHGQEAIIDALKNPEGQALSYRFKKDDKSWKVFISTALKKIEPISSENNGVIGIDLNVDHIACVITDRFGNPVERKVIPWVSYGKSKGQLRAITGDICKQIIEWAKSKRKSIVIEKLDFKKKKLTLAEKGENKFSRLLSSFAYGLFVNFLKTRAYKIGIKLHQVNPAYTSLIGRINYAIRYGLSTHLAAALCIARRYQKFSEAPCSPTGKVPDGKGSYVALALPERNRARHVWHFWAQVKKKLSTVLAAHFRAKKKSILESTKVGSCDSHSRILLVKF